MPEVCIFPACRVRRNPRDIGEDFHIARRPVWACNAHAPLVAAGGTLAAEFTVLASRKLADRIQKVPGAAGMLGETARIIRDVIAARQEAEDGGV